MSRAKSRLSSAAATVSSQNKVHPASKFQHTPSALAQLKKESRMMAKNPKKFLEAMNKDDSNERASRSKWQEESSDQLKALIEFIELAGGDRTEGAEGHQSRNHFKNQPNQLSHRLEDFQHKQKLSKTRALLLSMTSSSSQLLKAFSRKSKSGKGGNNNKGIGNHSPTPCSSATSLRSSPGRPSSYGSSRSSSGELFYSGRSSQSSSLLSPSSSSYTTTWNERNIDNIDRNSLEEMERALETFIDEIRNSDIDNILVWLSTLSTLEDYNLPYGLPSDLVMPQNPSCSSDLEISSFIETGLNTFLLLDAEYHKKLEEVSFKLKTNFEQLKTSRWSARDSALLYHILTSMASTYLGETPKSQQLLFQGQLFQRLFPGKTEEELVRHKYRIKMKRAWEEKRDNIIKDWIRDKDELKAKINLAWKEIQEKNERRVRLDLERRKQKEVCLHWKDLLENLRKEKRMKVRSIQMIVEPYERQTEERERLRMEAEEKKRLEQRKLVDDFRERRKLQVEKYKEEQEMLEAELEKNQRMQNKYNKTRVLVRQFELEKKQEAQRQLEKLKEEEKRLREALLEKSKYKVDLEEYDPTNVLKDTYASRLRNLEVKQFMENPEEEAMIKFFRERYSFSAESVCKDRRVRLESKLRDAGLMDTSYARQVLQAMQPPSKPHLKSNFKLQEDNPPQAQAPSS